MKPADAQAARSTVHGEWRAPREIAAVWWRSPTSWRVIVGEMGVVGGYRSRAGLVTLPG